jgi:UDP-glucuronate 4-epimerase
MARILVTGSAGFIGYHLTKRLCTENEDVYSIDSINDYYDPALKLARLDDLKKFSNHRFEKIALEDRDGIERVFKTFRPEIVVNLAAQAGVRYSLENPRAYTSSNIEGFINVLEGCRHYGVKHLVYASSSSVYGANKTAPFSVHHNVDHPISFYAATKKANELMAHTYAHLYNIPVTGLRFFTVYGPWGRPDMALFIFTKALYEGKPISLFNNGNLKRDFTYIDDIIEGVVRVIRNVPAPDPAWSGKNPDPASSSAPYRLYNIGNSRPAMLTELVSLLEKETGIEAEKKLLPAQPGDMLETSADTADLERDVGFSPSTSLETGIRHFVNWYRDHYKIGNGPYVGKTAAG